MCSPDIDKIIEDVINDMTLQEKNIIANMNEEWLPFVQNTFDRYLSDRAEDEEAAGNIIIGLSRRLRDTYKLRVVK